MDALPLRQRRRRQQGKPGVPGKALRKELEELHPRRAQVPSYRLHHTCLRAPPAPGHLRLEPSEAARLVSSRLSGQHYARAQTLDAIAVSLHDTTACTSNWIRPFALEGASPSEETRSQEARHESYPCGLEEPLQGSKSRVKQ